MRFLGIDYGAKRIGVAISDESLTLAFPKEIIINDSNYLDKIDKILKEEDISEIVMGESLDYKGEANKVMEEVTLFLNELKDKFNLPVHLEKEFLTSVEARRFQENGGKVDASAAALILQRYLDKKKKHDINR